MGVRLTSDEAWAFVEHAHTGIFTTLRRDGQPVALPVWFATVGGGASTVDGAAHGPPGRGYTLDWTSPLLLAVQQ